MIHTNLYKSGGANASPLLYICELLHINKKGERLFSLIVAGEGIEPPAFGL